MAKQQHPKENPLLSKNLPAPPPISADQPLGEKEQIPVPNSTLQQSSKTVEDRNRQQNDNTVKPQSTGKQQSSKTAQREKITFYLEPEQANKLYDFMEAFRQRTGVRINQQDMLRRMIDVVTIDTVLP